VRSVESHGKTVDEAISQALRRLGRQRDEVEVTVLSEGSRGVFGIGAEMARVRVTAPDVEVAEGAEVAPPVAAEAIPLERLGEIAQDMLTDILELMEIEAEVSVRGVDVESEDPSIQLDVEGDDLGVLIGRRGETLAALQHVLTMLVQRRLQRWVRVNVDVGHYQDRQAAILRSKALRLAERVQRGRAPLAMEPMRPAERRIIHMALADHPDVTTHSIGVGEDRRVVISPKT
jgi:spoIIIJ-associated protein